MTARADPELTCDVIMKGGITSGVVYPKAILQLAAMYRFRSVGGTSAGAIAASITAAAEYGRASGGFETLGAIPDTLQTRLLDLFQPDPRARDLFDLILTAGLQRRPMAALPLLIRAGLPWNLVALLPGLLLIWFAHGWAGWLAGREPVRWLGAFPYSNACRKNPCSSSIRVSTQAFWCLLHVAGTCIHSAQSR